MTRNEVILAFAGDPSEQVFQKGALPCAFSRVVGGSWKLLHRPWRTRSAMIMTIILCGAPTLLSSVPLMWASAFLDQSPGSVDRDSSGNLIGQRKPTV